jgi:hypothetical protein
MPFQVKAGSLIIVATNSAEALKLFDSLNSQADERVFIRDMNGVDIDPDFIRPILEAREEP